MVTLSAGIVPPEPVSGWTSETTRLVTGVLPAWTTTWKDSNSFRAAVIDAAVGPVTMSVGRTFTAEPTTTTVVALAPTGRERSMERTNAVAGSASSRSFLMAAVWQGARRVWTVSTFDHRPESAGAGGDR